MLWILWLLPALALAWTAQELEIFRLQDALVADLGEGASFYSWLGIARNADQAQIKKAYRHLSREIHPDKNAGADIEERFSRLSRVYKILKSNARDTYDFYLKKGFPHASEGEYIFKRYRPSIIAAVIVTLTISSVLHFLMLKADAIRTRQHLQELIDEAIEKAAAGPLGVASLKSKKTVRLQSNTMAAVYPDGKVYVVKNNVELLVSVDGIAEPTMKDTYLFSLPQRVAKYIKGKAASVNAATTAEKKQK